ncbi:unnamed protein product [Mytilus edulis]|uniref:OTU domain-containing protein n=2 Tax=Mytilus TaxID=6548 RepID=A0A8S3ULA0_MYTED|nr:unnamed protein product [Mytilus edulis]
MPKKSKKARSTRVKENKERQRKAKQEKNNNLRDGQCNNQSNSKDQSNTSLNFQNIDQSVISQNCLDLDQSVISQNCHDLDQSVISQNCLDLDQSIISQNCNDLDQSVISQNCHDLDQSVISQNCHDLDQSVISQNCHDLDQSVISQNCHDLDQSVISQNCHDLDQSVISQKCHDFDVNERIILENEIENILENEIENILENEIENILENRIEHLYENETEKLVQSVSSTNYQYKRNKYDDNIYQNKSDIQNQTEKLDQNQVEKLDKKQIEKLNKNQNKKIVQNQTEKLDQNQIEKKDENRIVKKKYENFIEQLDLKHNCPYIETESEIVLMNKVQLEQYQSKINNNTSIKAQCNNKINAAMVKDCVKVSRPGIRNTFLQGSFHQGDLRFGLNSGKQCVANCCSALAFSKLKDLTYWDQKYLDKVLIYGNDLYSRVSGNNHHLLISDLPPILDISGILMQLSLKESISAVIDTSESIDFSEFGNSLPLDQALQESLVDYDACFICAYDTSFLALKHGLDLFLFDSHARNEFGLKHSNGKSLLLKLSSLDHLYQYCCNMVSGASQNQWFEVTGVSISIVGEPVVYNNGDKSPENHKEMNNTNYSNIGNYETMNTSDYELPEIVEVENEKGSTLTKVHEKINVTFDIYSSESNANNNINKNESDVEIVSATDLSYDFKPINTIAKKKLCLIVKIPTKHIHKQITNTIFDMGPPSTTKSITGDGNCLFRAISYALSNRQEFYGNIRKAIVDHLIKNAEMFKSFLQPRFKTITEHIHSLQMKENNVWGTELEIIACADLLKTDIYTYYNDSWIKYSSSQLCNKNKINVQAIYLQHLTGINHYEVVTAVSQKSRYQNRMQSSPVEREKSEFDRKCEVPTLKINDSDNYSDDESKVLSKAEKERIRYRKDEEFKARKISTLKRKYRENETYRDIAIQAGIKKYREDKDYRDALKESGTQKYKENEDYRDNLIQSGIQKYQENDKYREKLKRASIYKYEEDEQHKKHVKQASVQKKMKSTRNCKQASVQKYKEDEKHKEHVKLASVQKYKEDEKHKEHVKQVSVKKYKEDEKHKEHVKQASIQKYADDDSHRCKVKQQTETRRENLKQENKQITEVIRKFKDAVKKGPECVCSCCLRLFFEKQVLICKKGSYDSSIYDSCTTEKYKHICTDDCNTHCAFEGTCRTSLWICYTCHRKMMRGKIPADSFSNGLMLEDVPLELKQLNSIEQQLIALNIPFMKIMALPKGGQKGVHGPIVCVPSDLKKVTTILPRSEDESLLLKVKLKRKLNYKGYDKYQYVRPNHLEQALVYLKDKNVWYKDVAINDEWINPIPEVNDDQVVNDESDSDSDDTKMMGNKEIQKDELENISKSSKVGNEREVESEQYSYIDDKLRGVQLDTCLQPADIGQEALDLCFDQVFNLAPAENNNPLSVLKEPGIEAKTFPVHFPSGKNTSDEDRDEKLTIGRYFNLRLMSVENRFARDTNYIFFSQYLTELNSVISNVQISLRKQCPFSKEGKKVTREMLCNKETLKELFKKDEAIKYLKPIQNAPKFGEDDIDDIITFIDKYITCEIPDEKEDKELHDIVMAVHQHSKKHSKSCKKKGTVCRFNFPRPPSSRTFISEPSDPDKDSEDDEELAKEILSDLWEVIKKHEDENLDVSEIFKKIGLTQESFETYYRFITNRNTVVLKRQPNEIYTNQYNPHLLRAWDANMDIQYILDAFSCVVYIISYISKAERELGLLLQQTKNEAEEGNLNAQQTMKKVGTSYLHHREISAQEAVFRVTGLRLRECSRKVEFIPVGENPCRMSVPLKDLEKQQNCKSSKRKRQNSDSEDEDENSTWMNNIVDRYKGRPHIDIFIKLCLARFTSEYSVILESQLPQKINKDTTFKLDGSLGYIRKRTRTSPAVIKYPRFSQENSPEKYYQSILQLYLPYRYDEQLKPLLFQTYENFFTCGRVKFQGDNTLSSVKEIVIKNMSDFVKNGHDLEEAEKQFHEKDPKEDAWCELCPEAEVNRRECIDEGKVSSVIEEDLSIPDLNEKSSSSVGTNLLSVSLTKNEIIPRLRSLNVKQRRILYKVRDWCIQKANGKTPEPLHLFITGGAGTGKSHLIKCIQYEATRILAQTTNNPDDLTLPPVRTKRVDKLYVDDPSNPSNQLWNGLFEIAELDEIMRQREDGMFAELLNRLRVKQKNESLSSSDKETLQHCFGDSPDEALHIYSTNAEVDTFNKEMIMKQCTESKLIEAQDFQKDKTSGKLTLKKVHCLKSDVCLPISILLAEGARVMLIKNEDTADGLVNGVMGTVISIKDFSPNSLPSTIYVHFDNERVGRNAKVQKLISGKHCVGLKPSSEDIPLSNCVRKQFPLKLAWACTIHKVQGLTVEECVVDLNKCFTYGQAYVALSRVTSKSGLHIESIEAEKIDKKIFCDPDIVKGVSEMTRFLPEIENTAEEHTQSFQIMYHNIQGLQTHAEDIKQNPDFRSADYICLTETWANQEFTCFEMVGYDGFHLPRSLAFQEDDSYYSSLKEMQHGGVCVFHKLSSETELCNLTSNLECIVFKIPSRNVFVATVYRTQRYNLGKFLENMETLICKLEDLSERVVVIGDFNQDILKGSCTVLSFMLSKGFRQLVSSPTTEGGTLIDHVYVKGCHDTQVTIIPTYYSYHEALKIVVPYD